MQSESAKRSRDFSQGCQAQERILLMSSAEGALDFEGASRLYLMLTRMGGRRT